MKPNQASIYREIERLLEWSIPVVERLPRSLPYKELGGLLIRDLKEALDFVVLAFQADGTLENLKLLKRHVSSLNSYMGFCVHEYTFNRRKKMFSNAPYFWKCCNIQRRFSVVKVKRKFNYESSY